MANDFELISFDPITSALDIEPQFYFGIREPTDNNLMFFDYRGIATDVHFLKTVTFTSVDVFRVDGNVWCDYYSGFDLHGQTMHFQDGPIRKGGLSGRTIACEHGDIVIELQSTSTAPAPIAALIVGAVNLD